MKGNVWKRLTIQLQRAVDHARRFITGVPGAHRSEVTPYLYIGGQFFEHGLDNLQDWGITGVINMREEKAPLPFSQVEWLKTLHLPTPDHHAPAMRDFEKGVAFINEQRQKNGKVYIHCRAGEGRAPSMAAAYLMSEGLSFDDALLLIKSARPFVSLSFDQIIRLHEWERKQAKQQQQTT